MTTPPGPVEVHVTGPGFSIDGSFTITDTSPSAQPAPPAAPPPGPPAPVPAAPPVLCGSTVNPRAYGLPGTPAGWLAAAQRWDSYAGRAIAVTCQKRYERATPARPSPVYGALPGAHYLISVKPGWAGASAPPAWSDAEGARLAAFIAALRDMGVSFDMTPWQEGNLKGSPFGSPAVFIPWFRLAAEVIRAAGVRCVYDPGGSDPDTALSFYPGDGWTDAVTVDYYTGAYYGRRRVRLGQFAPLAWSRADGRKVPFGVAEYGDNISGARPDPAFGEYAAHIAGFLGAALARGDPVYGAICFGYDGPSGAIPGKGAYNTLNSPDDHKVAGIRAICDALPAGGAAP